mmetsp:Transcript_62/g.155  ORF Transcript_62/g.155 Transcript_62/m.155 type:complete len:223 (-) Transcript_62:153-821(-)
MPESSSCRTAERTIEPPRTGTMKVLPNPMLTTTPEVSRWEKRQSEAESTMASLRTPKPCSSCCSVSARQASRPRRPGALKPRSRSPAYLNGSETMAEYAGSVARLRPSRRNAVPSSEACEHSCPGWQIWRTAGARDEARPYFAYPRPLSTQTVEESDSLVVRYTSRHGCPDADDCRSTPAAAPLRAVGFASGCENEPSTFSLKSNDAPCFPATHRARHTKSE